MFLKGSVNQQEHQFSPEQAVFIRTVSELYDCRLRAFEELKVVLLKFRFWPMLAIASGIRKNS